MAFPTNFFPIEMEGISIISALIFFFASISITIFISWNRQEHNRLNKCVDNHVSTIEYKIEDTNDKVDTLFNKMDETNKMLTETNTYLARTIESIEWIKKSMELNTHHYKQD